MFEALIDRIEREERLSVAAKKLKGKLEPMVGHDVVRDVVRDVLTGRWLGHPAHPAVVIAPLAGWFGGTLLDVVGGAGSSTAARPRSGRGRTDRSIARRCHRVRGRPHVVPTWCGRHHRRVPEWARGLGSTALE